MKKVVLGLVVIMMAGNAYAMNDCKRLPEVDTQANKVRSLIAQNLSLSKDELVSKLDALTVETQDLAGSVLGCDKYFDDLINQSLAALAHLREVKSI